MSRRARLLSGTHKTSRDGHLISKQKDMIISVTKIPSEYIYDLNC